MKNVYVEECREYSITTIKTILTSMFQAMEKEKNLLHAGCKVVIKPNLVSARSIHQAATTHPTIIEAIIEICQEKGCLVTIAESPAGKMDEAKMRLVFEKTGLREVANRHQVQLKMSDESVEVPLKNHPATKVEVLKSIMEADVVINCCKLKSHSYTVFTGAVKNNFGVMPGLIKAQMHAKYPRRTSFGTFIADLADTIAPQLNVMDAIVGMHKEGPTNGEPIALHRLLASTDCFALDEVAMQMVQIDSAKTPVQAAAYRMKCLDRTQVNPILSPSLYALKIEGFIAPKHLTGLLKMMPSLTDAFSKWTAAYPVVQPELCIGCQECIKDCPQRTIELIDQKAHVLRKNCIRCYCCQEVCPANAIEIRRK